MHQAPSHLVPPTTAGSSEHASGLEGHSLRLIDSGPPPGGINVLLIEDNPGDAFLLSEILEANETPPSVRVQHVTSLAAAHRFLKTIESDSIDCVLLDLFLPDSDGLETLDRFQEKAADLPVVVLTGLADDRTALEALHRGAEDYITKGDPERATLLKAIRFARERHASRRKLDSMARELRSANTRLERLSMIDPLTEMLNRRGLEKALERETSRARREESALSAVLVDLDDFKSVNDSLGHSVGDVVLGEVARRIHSNLRGSDCVSRIGGDEFLCLLPGTDERRAIEVAEKLRRSISTAPLGLWEGEELHVTTSLGTCVVDDSTNIEALLSKLTASLQRSKREGKNRVSPETPLGPRPVPSEDLASVLNASLEDPDAFAVARQPIISVDGMALHGYELLIRPRIEGLERPDHLFQASMEANLLTAMDLHCLRLCVTHSLQIPEDVHCHLNVFPTTLMNLPVERLIEVLDIVRARDRICLEISEKQFLCDPSRLLEKVEGLREAGFSFAVDDVGFGNSCLEALVRLGPEVVKIDRSCVDKASQNPTIASALEKIVAVADTLGSEVVAEGVELEEDLQLLRDLGVGYVQGFLVGRPLCA